MLKKILNSIDSPNVMVFEKIEDLLDFLDTKGHSLDTLGSFSKIVNKNKNKEEKMIMSLNPNTFAMINGSDTNTANNQKINLTKIKQEAKEKSSTREDAVKELILHLRNAKEIRVPKKLGKVEFADVYNNLIEVSKTMEIADENAISNLNTILGYLAELREAGKKLITQEFIEDVIKTMKNIDKKETKKFELIQSLITKDKVNYNKEIEKFEIEWIELEEFLIFGKRCMKINSHFVGAEKGIANIVNKPSNKSKVNQTKANPTKVEADAESYLLVELSEDIKANIKLETLMEKTQFEIVLGNFVETYVNNLHKKFHYSPIVLIKEMEKDLKHLENVGAYLLSKSYSDKLERQKDKLKKITILTENGFEEKIKLEAIIKVKESNVKHYKYLLILLDKVKRLSKNIKVVETKEVPVKNEEENTLLPIIVEIQKILNKLKDGSELAASCETKQDKIMNNIIDEQFEGIEATLCCLEEFKGFTDAEDVGALLGDIVCNVLEILEEDMKNLPKYKKTKVKINLGKGSYDEALKEYTKQCKSNFNIFINKKLCKHNKKLFKHTLKDLSILLRNNCIIG